MLNCKCKMLNENNNREGATDAKEEKIVIEFSHRRKYALHGFNTKEL